LITSKAGSADQESPLDRAMNGEYSSETRRSAANAA
jgi:hypothetical protein